jgi:hypothetical protein
MKSFRPVLWVSLVVNLILLAAFVSGHARFDRRPNDGLVMTSPDARDRKTNNFAPLTWESLNQDDVKARIAQLSAAGYPRSVIRAIIRSQLNDEFAAKRKALFASTFKDGPYWRASKEGAFNSQFLAALRKLSQDHVNAMTVAIGEDFVEDEQNQSAVWARRFGGMPREKVLGVQAVLSDYSELKAQIMDSLGGVMLNEDRAKLALLESEQRADLEKILTPKELEDYQLRNSSVAAVLRSQLALFSPTEEEFRSIFRLQDKFETEFPKRGGTVSSEETRRKAEAQDKLNQEILGLLGPERYSDYKQAADPASQAVNRVLARFDLPIQAAKEAMSIQQQTTDAARLVNAQASLSAEQRADQLKNLADGAKNRLTGLLGKNAADAYLEVNGSWLQRLQTVNKTTVSRSGLPGSLGMPGSPLTLQPSRTSP